MQPRYRERWKHAIAPIAFDSELALGRVRVRADADLKVGVSALFRAKCFNRIDHRCAARGAPCC
jgi:hypothetical protein